MKDSFKEGTIYGILLAGFAFLIVQFLGYSPRSLSLLLYLYVISSILLTMKSEISEPIKPLLEKVVIVAEGEEMKMKKLLTGEEYRLRGEVEKL
jgi:hypothetical protein